MSLELAPGAVDTDDTFLVLFVPENGIANLTTGPTVAELTAPTVKKGTYSLTTDGWAFARAEASGTDDRLTLKQVFESRGKITDSLEITYVYGSDDDILDPLLEPGWKGFVCPRYAIPNETAITAAQLVDIIPVEAGAKRKNPPAANAKWTKTQKLFVRAPGTQDDVAIAAS